MSGGVDSSVAALLLKEQGYDVIGVFMNNWEETGDDGVCTAEEDYNDVRRVCEIIDIPYYGVNFSKEYKERVFSYFLSEYSAGRTPNPDVLCNNEIKFKAFLSYAEKADAEVIATGHFVRRTERGGLVRLLKGADGSKDQSYFLSGLHQSQIQKAVFPVGDMLKKEVRRIAEKAGLPNAAKKDSTGVCFIGERDFKKFLMQYLPSEPGDIIDIKTGTKIGRHDGLSFFTIGQRKGMNIGGGFGDGRPWFVVKKDIANNLLYAVQGDDPVLYSSSVFTSAPSFIADGIENGQEICVKCRYRQPDMPARVFFEGDGLRIELKSPLRAVAPGQFAVLYSGDECLGGAPIEKAE